MAMSKEGGRMSKFQKRHYEAIAMVLAHSFASENVISSMIGMFKWDNHNFDEVQFRSYLAGFSGGGI